MEPTRLCRFHHAIEVVKVEIKHRIVVENPGELWLQLLDPTEDVLDFVLHVAGRRSLGRRLASTGCVPLLDPASAAAAATVSV